MILKSPLIALPLALAGCGFLGIGTPPQQQLSARTFASPYGGLAAKSVAIVVVVPMATLNEFTGAREEISTFVATQMRGHMPATRLLDPREVVQWQARTMNWASLPPRDVGRHFGVDRVLYIQVLDYSTQRPVGVSSLQGRLRATCRVYETEAGSPGPGATGRMEPVWTGLVDAAWPSGKALDPTQTNEDAVRLRTLDAFADLLVRCFQEPTQPPGAIRG